MPDIYDILKVKNEQGEWITVPALKGDAGHYTAGDNIIIEDDVISAIDTIYDDTEVKADIAALESGKADKAATYTKTEVDTALSVKADSTALNAETLRAAAAEAAIAADVTNLESTVTSQSSQIATLDEEKADADSVYTKGETDALLAEKADSDAVYTKAEADNLLDAKADSADVYTKTEVDNSQSAQNALITALQAENARQNRQLEIHAKALEGLAYTFETDITEGYSKSVPSGALAVAVNKIGGKTEVKNQLVESVIGSTAYDVNVSWDALTHDVTITNVARTTNFSTGNSWDLSLYEPLLVGHVYYIYTGKNINGIGLSANNTVITVNGSRVFKNTISMNNTFRITSNYDFVSDHPIGNVETIKFRITDMTVKFNVTDEGQVTDSMKAEVDNELDLHPTFVGSELISADVKQINSTKADDTLIDSRTIPQALRTAHPLRSARTVYDEYDFARKKFVQRVGSVDLGTLNWEERTSTYGDFFAGYQSDIAYKGATYTTDLFCKKYVARPATSVTASSSDKIIAGSWTTTSIYIRDADYDSIDAFKTAMNGVMLYYELATPVEYDISSYLTDFDTTMLTEGGGAITFVQEDTEIAIPNELKYTVKVADAL